MADEGHSKWPVIVAIIVGSLIVISLIWCCARCLCCGAECCCGCLSCCNRCCPSPRRKDKGYQQAPPTPFYNQYQQPPPPMYAAQAAGGYRSANVPQTATFETAGKNGTKYNEDALPAMPSWDHATSRREEVVEDVEMEKLGSEHHDQQDTLLPQQQQAGRYYGGSPNVNRTQDFSPTGDIGNAPASPYHDYQQPQASPYAMAGARSPYSPPYQQPAASPYTGSYGDSSGYFNTPAPQQQTYASQPYVSPPQPYAGQHRGGGGYEPSIPPSYHTRPPSDVVSPLSPSQGAQPAWPGQTQYQAYGGGGGGGGGSVSRKPVQGSWREV